LVAIEEEANTDENLSDILEQNQTLTELDGGDEGLEHSGSAICGSNELMERDKVVALWILKLKESRKVTQSTTEEILADASELFSDMFTRLKKDVYQILAAAGPDIESDCVERIKELFSDTSPYLNLFSSLGTQYLQMQYFKKHLNFVVSLMKP